MTTRKRSLVKRIGWRAALALLVLGGFARQPVSAQESPRQLIEHTINQALDILRDEKLKTQSRERLRALRTVVDGAFDWEAMAKSSLGAPWRALDETQRTEFVSVFKELLAQRYMDDIDRFQGSEQLTVTGADSQGELTVVKTVLLTTSREQIPIDYTLHRRGPEWRVDDVSIEGVSLVNHYRKTFAQYLSNKTFQQLLDQLKRKLGVRDSQTPGGH
ncbi:MAG: ABC transporter substrate-binding protein [Polyangiales bacterium]